MKVCLFCKTRENHIICLYFQAGTYYPTCLHNKQLDQIVFISNPQKNGVPQKFDTEQLIQDWIKSNNTFAKAQFEQYGLHYLEAEKSHYAWTFNLNKQQLQTALTLEYFVPQIFYIKKTNSHLVQLLCIWPGHCPFVLPKVDFVHIIKTETANSQEGLISYDHLMKELGNKFEEKEGYHIIHMYNSIDLEDQFNALPIEMTLSSYGSRLSLEKIANIILEDLA